MENSNCDSDSGFRYPMNHSPTKDNDKGKTTVFDVSSACGFASSKSKSKALVLYDDIVATAAASSSSNCHRHRAHRNPRKRRSKLISFVDGTTATTDISRFLQGPNSFSKRSAHLKPKYGSKKPDPSAPKITEPCSECGKKFWSWKALFGHMRCHPERQWRGIKPPPNFRQQPSSSSPGKKDDKDTSCSSDSHGHQFQDGGGGHVMLTHDEHEVAACLMLLANGEEGRHIANAKADISLDEITHTDMYGLQDLNCQGFAGDSTNACTVPAEEEGGSMGFSCGRSECSNCKKVFWSHQSLGGHRASYKNVKGGSAIKRTLCTAEDVDCAGGRHDLQDCQTHNHTHENYTSAVSDYHCYQTDQSQSTTSVLLQEEEALDCKDSITNASDSKIVIALGNGHKCSICSKVFSSGQALGGHKRCHWEKADNETVSVSQGITSPLAVATTSGGAALSLKEHSNVDGTDTKNDLDLNLPAPLEDDSSCSYSSLLTLDLRLGI